MGEQTWSQPYRRLGLQLKLVRQKLQESLNDVSGAVEVEVGKLERFERGVDRPSEEVLMLLISHFGMQDDEAIKLWEIAGYGSSDRSSEGSREDAQVKQPFIMMLAMDNRVLYTDGVKVSADASGMVLDFTQGGGVKADTVARIGMSYTQAHNVLQAMVQQLNGVASAMTPKGLPAPKDSSRTKKPKD